MTDTDIVESLLQPDKTSRDRHLFGPGPKRILSFDGGGVRGAISVAFLERIERIFAEHQHKLLSDYIAVKERAGINDATVAAARKKLLTFRLADWFDLVGGTSTGALIAGAVALGFNTSQIKSFYTERAPSIFQRPFWRIPGLQAKFDARALQQEIDTIVKDCRLDSDELITGLSVVAKRMDTGSPWILTNNPRSPYWETKPPDPEKGDPGYIGNRLYKLGTLVRASTAAPHFFDPEIVQIIAEEERKAGAAGTQEKERGLLDRMNDKLGRFPRLTMLLTRIRARQIAETKGPNPNTHGLFVDGGVTPFNNPSFAILMQVALKPFGICWPLGPDKLTFVSIGTGSYRTKVSFKELGWSRQRQARAQLASVDDGRYPDACAGADAMARGVPRPVGDQFGDRDSRQRNAARTSLVSLHALRRRIGAPLAQGKDGQGPVRGGRCQLPQHGRCLHHPDHLRACGGGRREAGQARALLPEAGRLRPLRPARHEPTGRGWSPASPTADWPDPSHSAASQTASSGHRA